MNKWLEFINHYFYLLVPAVLLVFYVYATDPLSKRNAAIHTQLAEATQSLEWMQQQAPHASQQATTSPGKTLTTVEALSHIEQLARNHKILGQVKNLRPVNKQTVRLWMKAVDFHRFISMLDELLRYGHVAVDKLQITVGQQSGQANIELTLKLTS